MMKVVLMRDLYHDDQETMSKLKKGFVTRVYIVEHEKNDKPENGWYLIHTGFETKYNYVSDPDIAAGRIIQTYRDPELGNYKEGPYMWIHQHEAKIFHENNRDAKFLLKKNEWSV